MWVERMVMWWREETNVGVREGMAGGLALALALINIVQQYLHAILNFLGTLSSGPPSA